MTDGRFYGTVRAPEFPAGAEWINTTRPLAIAGLRGKVVLLDFWTYGCINCIHVIPDLKTLEALYPDVLVVIGVHSSKFANERDAANVSRVVQRYGVEHPVVVDPDLRIWQSYGVRAWPTTVLIDPRGRIVAQHSGEGVLRVYGPFLAEAVARYEGDGVLDRAPLQGMAPEPPPPTALSFPGKVLADEAGDRLYIADTGHHRIVVTDLGGTVRGVIGSGARGLEDGPYAVAAFSAPQGLALDGATLYVADTENHAIRAVDLAAGTVRTVAGDGTIGYAAETSDPLRAHLNSPWDLEVVGRRLYIAMAGLHQIWVLDLEGGTIAPYAGTRAEALLDGPRGTAALAQPSGLTSDGEVLYFADSESSAIRYVELGPYARVQTIIGEGLFEFGDVDGRPPAARLQHPLGVLWYRDRLWVADTYNHKIKVAEPTERRVTTFAGSGRPGFGDGADAAFYEPGGLSGARRRLYVADTNNHAIRLVDTETGDVGTLALRDPEGLLREAPKGVGPGASEVRAPEQRLGPGPGRIELRVELPAGHTLNELAPSSVVWHPGESVRAVATRATIDPSSGTAVLGAEFAPGRGVLEGEVTAFHCAPEDVGLCLIHAARVLVPLAVAEGVASHTVRVTLSVPRA